MTTEDKQALQPDLTPPPAQAAAQAAPVAEAPATEVPFIMPEEADVPEAEVAAQAIPAAEKASKPHYTRQYPEFSPMPENYSHPGVQVQLPPDHATEIQKWVDDQPNVEHADNDPGREWVDTLENSAALLPRAEQLRRTVEDPEAEFTQAVQSDAGILYPSSPRFDDSVGKKLAGEAGVLRVRALLGMGNVVQIPLFHSGFWISLKAPMDSDLLALNQRLQMDKIALGRQTYGLLYGNHSVYTVQRILAVALEHLYATSLADSRDLINKIAAPDIITIVWGMACSIWTSGFPYSRAVVNDPKDPHRIVREILNISKLFYTNQAKLTKWQRNHMAKRNEKMTDESIKRYRDEFALSERRIELRSDLAMTLRIPSAGEYLDAGQAWVDSIVHTFGEAFANDPDDDRRNDYLLDQGKATAMRQYVHWVKEIHPGKHVIEDRDTINTLISDFSKDSAIRAKYFKEIQQFIDDITISLIAVPTITDADEKDTKPDFPHLLPIDPIVTFFILLGQKALMIQGIQ